MAKLMGRRAPAIKVETISADNALDVLSSEFRLGKEKLASILRSAGIKVEGAKAASELPLYREIIACKLGECSRFAAPDEAYLGMLDEQLRSFDEIYVDTAPIIQLDYFLYFVTNAEPILKRRKKKLLILEKTMEELHGLKDNPEKDLEVRVRATIRPDLIRQLAKRGIVRIGDTGQHRYCRRSSGLPVPSSRGEQEPVADHSGPGVERADRPPCPGAGEATQGQKGSSLVEKGVQGRRRTFRA
jgi:hypothetical protein